MDCKKLAVEDVSDEGRKNIFRVGCDDDKGRRINPVHLTPVKLINGEVVLRTLPHPSKHFCPEGSFLNGFYVPIPLM